MPSPAQTNFHVIHVPFIFVSRGIFTGVCSQVEPILEVLVGKTLELSVLELMEVSKSRPRVRVCLGRVALGFHWHSLVASLSRRV